MKYFFILTFLLPFLANAQSDTTIFYVNETGDVTVKDSAVYLRKFFKKDELWKEVEYWITGELNQEGYYLDQSRKNKTGTWVWYNKKGVLVEKSLYSNDKKLEHFRFHEDGKTYMHAIFNADESLQSVKGWDEAGNEIAGFIYQQEATFPGGMKAWRDYLTLMLDNDLPKAYRRGKISGKVTVLFRVGKDGLPSHVILDKSSGHPELDEHALNIIRKSPAWNPAIQFNRKVIYRQKQTITYAEVEE